MVSARNTLVRLQEARVGGDLEARQRLQKSVSLPWPKERSTPRAADQVHPDKYNGDPIFADRVLELSMKVNEAMRVARENAKARGEL